MLKECYITHVIFLCANIMGTVTLNDDPKQISLLPVGIHIHMYMYILAGLGFE